MITNRIIRRIICIILSISLVTSICGCASTEQTQQTAEVVQTENSPIIVDGVEIKDSFVKLEINPIQVREISTEEIDVDKIIVNCIEVKEIENLEIELASINDEFVYLAYKNFVSVYGDDFDLKDFLIDAGIGCGCILVFVTLSTVAGPVGTFFGAVITSQFTASAMVIGAALDAAVSAYQAYKEGGDVSYIIGHMLNGIADGIKWSAILAPVTGIVDGIKALRAVDKLRKIPGFEDITDKEARKIFEMLADIIDKTSKNADNLTDDVIKKLSKELSEEISEDLLKKILTNRSMITDIVKTFNPFNVSNKVIKAMQDSFLRRAGLEDDVAKELVKEIKKGAIKNLDDITDVAVREFVEKNMYEFLECFGGSLSKEFIDNCLKKNLGEDVFILIKDSIANSNTLYADLIEKVGKKSAEEILSDSNTLVLLQLRYGTKNVNKLLNASVLYELMRKNNDIPEDQLRTVLKGLMDGSYRSLDEISEVSEQIAKNLRGSGEVVSQSIKSIGKEKALSGVLDDLARAELESIGLPSAFADDIITNRLSKDAIVEKYGVEAYQSLFAERIVENERKTVTVTVSNFNNCMNCLSMQAKINDSLLKDMAVDALKNSGISDDVIEDIIAGKAIKEWGVSEAEAVRIYHIIADYYKMTDVTTYRNYIKEIAEVRGNYISEFMESYRANGNTLINDKYLGAVMSPSGDNASYIKAKYGDIYMSKQGFVILDDFAVARVELTNLTGLNGGNDDIIRANLAHHGTQTNIPGYTWHHLEDGKTMILVPTELHEAYRHTGGADLLREGLKEAVNG